MIKISPSILSADFANLGPAVKKIDEAGADLIHIDVMDGAFVPNMSFAFPVISAIRPYTDKPFDVHLMIENPEKYIEEFYKAGADIITIHAESTNHPHRALQAIRALGIKAGIALCPGTDISAVKNLLPLCDMILIMTVNPGFGGQKFIDEMLIKIAELKEMIGERDIDIEVDGGISSANAKDVIKAGANVLVAGSAIFGALDPAKEIALMKEV